MEDIPEQSLARAPTSREADGCLYCERKQCLGYEQNLAHELEEYREQTSTGIDTISII